MVIVFEHPSAQPTTVVMRTPRRRPDRDRRSARACNSAPPMAGHVSSNVEALLVGIVKGVVDFLLRMLGTHSLSNIGLVFPLVNGPTSRVGGLPIRSRRRGTSTPGGPAPVLP